MKLTTCKRCDAKNVYWVQSIGGKWILNDEEGSRHRCEDGKLKAVKCKYCNVADLHWAEEVNSSNQVAKMVLTESYGLPHACDERLAFVAREKQQKKDKYEAEKKRVATHPDGTCPPCKGSGFKDASSRMHPFALCENCHGNGQFNERTRKQMLANERRKIWPNMKENYTSYGRSY